MFGRTKKVLLICLKFNKLKKKQMKKGDNITFGNKKGKITYVFETKSFLNPQTEYKIKYQTENGSSTARVTAKEITLKK